MKNLAVLMIISERTNRCNARLLFSFFGRWYLVNKDLNRPEPLFLLFLTLLLGLSLFNLIIFRVCKTQQSGNRFSTLLDRY